MANRSPIRSTSALGALACCASAFGFALQVPAGAEIQVRLKTKISTQSSTVKDPVEAVRGAASTSFTSLLRRSGVSITRGYREALMRRALPMLLVLAFAGTAHSHVLERIAIVTILVVAIATIGQRLLFAAAAAALIMAVGGWQLLQDSATPGKMTRSFFGIYSVRPGAHNSRVLVHGTTVHGVQNLGSPERERIATSYYAPLSGVGLAMTAAPQLFGPNARIAVVGLGAGTLACYAQSGQSWTFYEIDPAVVRIARDPARFTFLSRCTPDARIEVGDARLLIERETAHQVDLLVLDAFSSDAVPMHLLTREAFADYRRLLAPGGLLLVHISNRFIELDPVVAAAARAAGWESAVRRYRPGAEAAARNEGASDWVAMSPSAHTFGSFLKASRAPWTALGPSTGFKPWTDDHASVLPLIHWAGTKT